MIPRRRTGSVRWLARHPWPVVALLWLAGCLGGSAGPEAAAPADLDLESGAFITGILVDPELVPVVGADVFVAPGDLSTTTGEDGAFGLGPVEPGSYEVTSTKTGYLDATTKATARDGVPTDLFITMVPNDPDVPYHETQIFVTFVNCWSANLIGNVPCTKLVDYVAGTELSPDETFAYTWEVPNPGLVDILAELDWQSQALGSDMVFQVLTPPGQAVTALVDSYFSMSGQAPLRGWIVAGIVNSGGEAEFNGEPEEVTYETRVIPRNSNTTVPYHAVWINQRTESFITFFYNRAGSRDFTAVEDR